MFGVGESASDGEELVDRITTAAAAAAMALVKLKLLVRGAGFDTMQQTCWGLDKV